MRPLFSSMHGHLDPSSGAAIATRELLELPSSRGSERRVFMAGVLDDEEGTSLDQALGTQGLPAPRFAADLSESHATDGMDVEAGRVRCTILATRSGQNVKGNAAGRERRVTASRADSVIGCPG